MLPCVKCTGLWLTKEKWKKISSKIQVASRELRMPLSNIHLRGTSTETVPNANISGGSVVADLNGLAVKVKIVAVAPKSWTPSRLELRRCCKSIQLLSPSHTLLGKTAPSPSRGLSQCPGLATLPSGRCHLLSPSLLTAHWSPSPISSTQKCLFPVPGCSTTAALVQTRASCQGHRKALSVHTSFIAFHSGFLQPGKAFPQNKSDRAVLKNWWFINSFSLKSWPLSRAYKAPIPGGLSLRPVQASSPTPWDLSHHLLRGWCLPFPCTMSLLNKPI